MDLVCLEKRGRDLPRDLDRSVCVRKRGRDLTREVDRSVVCRKERERLN